VDLKDYSIKQSDLVEKLRVSPGTIDNWVQSGELIAIDVRRHGAKRASWRFNEQDLESFLSKRSNQPEQMGSKLNKLPKIIEQHV
jgi:predicted site-specific integrase-resolvase